ncbi:protein ALP1-like [Senna tora]|uniref:Protein ALP1-like n=1 Tax=Senna tora TaxID=362788 RepID=A0A834TQP3_9FABA|nr:protein ALP1-like [Senna tora]
MRHSAVQNVIERCFGMLKNRWAILRSPSFYPVKIHNMIVIVCCLLHNLIRRDNAGDPLDNEAENLVPEPAEEPAEVDAPISTGKDRATRGDSRDAEEINDHLDFPQEEANYPSNDVMDGFKEITEPFLHRLDKIVDGMNRIAREKALDEKREALCEALSQVDGLTDDELIREHLRLASDPALMVCFFGLEERLKLRWLQQIIG